MSEGQLFELDEDEELRVEVDCGKVILLFLIFLFRRLLIILSILKYKKILKTKNTFIMA